MFLLTIKIVKSFSKKLKIFSKNRTKSIESDRKWYKMPCRTRNTYVSKILNKKERKKMVKTVAGLEREVWAEMSWTPLEELEKWHDDKLRTEVRMLEQVRSVQC